MDENENSQVQNEQPAQVETSPAPPMSPPQPIKRGKSPKKGPIFIALIIALGLLIYFLTKDTTQELSSSPTPDSILVGPETPSPTQTPEPERDTISIEVLNGTGIAGEAGFLQEKLDGVGYTKVEVGNADSTDNIATTVTFSSELADSVVEELTKLLEETYDKVDVTTSRSADNDVSIVTGLRKGQTPKPSATPTAKPSASPTGTPTSSPSASPTT